MIRPKSALVGALVLTAMASAVAAQGVPLGTPIPQKPLGRTIGEDRGAMAFAANQLTFRRVASARQATDARLRKLFEERGVPYPASEIFLRVFKHERLLELWARPQPDSAFVLVKTYPVCALPGQLGPKRRMGDVQVPEGFYFIDQFNPESAFHLSLRVSYPNLADRMRREALALGGDIFIHGGCETVGCVPIENQNIEEVYWLAVQAMDAGQKLIPVHIFPTRLDPRRLTWLEENFDPEPALLEFWKNLADGYAFFEDTHRVPWVTVAQDGRYAVPAHERLAAPAAADDDAAPTAAATPRQLAADSADLADLADDDSRAAGATAAADATAAAGSDTRGSAVGSAAGDAALGADIATAGVPAGPGAALLAAPTADPARASEADDTVPADTVGVDAGAADTVPADTVAAAPTVTDTLALEALPRGVVVPGEEESGTPADSATTPDSARVAADSVAPDSATVPDSARVATDSVAPDSAAGPSLPGRPVELPADTAAGKAGGAPGAVKRKPKAKPGGGGPPGA